MSEEQSQTIETVEGNLGDGSEEAAILALAKSREVTTQPEGETVEVEEGQEAEAEPEPIEEEATEEVEAEADVAQVEIDGEIYQVPSKLKDGFLRQAEFSRNMNEVSEQRKVAETTIKEATQMREMAESYAVELAKVYQLESRVKSFQDVDWQTLRLNNPAEYAAMAADLRTAELDLDRQIANTKLVKQNVEEANQNVISTKRQEMFKTLEKTIPKWGDELGTKITNYALNNGFTVEDLTLTTNPKFVESIYKSMRYDELQKAKDTMKDKIRSVNPVLKPSNKPVNADKTPLEHFNKNRNSTEAAIAAIRASRR